MMRSKVSRNFVLLAPPSCGEVSANKSANVGALIFIVTLFGSVLIIAYHPPFVQRFLKYRIKNHKGWKFLYEENQAKPGKYVLRINGVFVKSTGMVYNENPDNGIAYPKVLVKLSNLF